MEEVETDLKVVEDTDIDLTVVNAAVAEVLLVNVVNREAEVTPEVEVNPEGEATQEVEVNPVGEATQEGEVNPEVVADFLIEANRVVGLEVIPVIDEVNRNLGGDQVHHRMIKNIEIEFDDDPHHPNMGEINLAIPEDLLVLIVVVVRLRIMAHRQPLLLQLYTATDNRH